jgi:hypothetical protein
MKNIHILPTDKPSRLYKDDNQVLTLNTHPVLKGIFTNGIGSNQHIYITSDEEIKEGDWFLSLTHDESYLEVYKYDGTTYLGEDKKIILTTDQSLDGIQSIDDEFLEWFVKNPSCENVEIEIKPMFPMYSTFIESIDNPPFYGNLKRKIIIPQEEPKQETLEEAADIERIAMDKLKNKWGHLYTFGYPQRPFPTNYENDLNNIKIGLYEGTKWQQERMYSDMEEYSAFVLKSYKEGLPLLLAKEWFEQFKNK